MLADAMAVDLAVAERFCTALEANGVVEAAGSMNGGARKEVIYEHWSLTPREFWPHAHPCQAPPEVTTPGVYDLAPRRGVPVTGSSQRSTGAARRGWLSQAGGGRARHKKRERERAKLGLVG